MQNLISEPKQIILKKTAYMNLLRTVIESASREPTGFLFGFQRKSKCTFTNAYPVITADRTPTSASYGNKTAINRIRQFYNLMHSLKALEGNWVGGYHSHPLVKGDDLKVLTRLSSSDIDFIDDEMKAHNQEYWIEIIVRFHEKKLLTKHKMGKKVKMHKNKMKVVLTDSPNHKYYMLISAYLIKKKSKDSKITIKNISKRKPKKKFNRRDFIVKELKVRHR